MGYRDQGQSAPRTRPVFNVVVPDRERCDDWVELDEALEQAAAFLGLGCEAITIERRTMVDLVRVSCSECKAPLLTHPTKPGECFQCGATVKAPCA